MPQDMVLSEVCKLIHSSGILTCECHICWDRDPSFSVYFSSYLRVGHFNAQISQAAKNSRAKQEALIDITERIGMFLRRLEVYIEVPSTTEMMDMMVQIMAEIFSILGIATKEMKQGRLSKRLLYKYKNVDRGMFRKIREEVNRKV